MLSYKLYDIELNSISPFRATLLIDCWLKHCTIVLSGSGCPTAQSPPTKETTLIRYEFLS